jgi:CRP/FNR family transcriptional regulator, cyclic AMP receptor protein
VEAYIRPSGPIGSNVVMPRQMSSTGMMVAGLRPVPGQSDAPDFNGVLRTETFANNAVIHRLADPGDRAFVVKSGRVRILRVGPDASRSVTSILRPGDLFGDLFRPEGHAADELAVASGEAEVWCIEAREFRAQLTARPALATHLLKAHADQARSLHRRVMGLTFKDVPARLAEMILMMAEAHGERCPHGGEVDIRGITQQDFADLVGASRSFVSTLINEMKRDGLLGNVGRVLCVRDQRALKKLSEAQRTLNPPAAT